MTRLIAKYQVRDMESETQFPKMIVPFKVSGRKESKYDLRVLLYQGGAILPPSNLEKITQLFLGPPLLGRLPLVTAIYTSLQNSLAAGITERSIGTRITILRFFWSFCEKKELTLDIFSTESLKSTFAIWVSEQWQRTRTGEIKEETAQGYSWHIAILLSEALLVPRHEFVAHIAMPRRREENHQHDKMDLAVVDGFLSDIEDIISSLTIDVIRGSWPMVITLRSGPKIAYNGRGRTVSVHGSNRPNNPNSRREKLRSQNISFATRQHAIGLRTQAECLLFIGATGMNLQPTLDLCINDVAYQSFGDQYRVTGFKNRKGDKVNFRIPKYYRATFDRWLIFRATAFESLQYERLFPLLDENQIEDSVTGERGFRMIGNLLERAGRPRLSAYILRYAKSQKLVRLAAIGGDFGKVASELQHALPTLLRSYFKGSQQMAAVEFAKFFITIKTEESRHRLRNGGDCGLPHHPELIEIATDAIPQPDCINPAGCFFCVHFRAIESFDYLHSILSYKELLRLRSGAAHESATWDVIIKPTMERVDDYVSRIEDSSEEMRYAANDARQRTKAGDYHARWRGWIELFINPGIG